MEERGEHRKGGERAMPGDRERASGTDADQHEADVVDRRVGEEALQVRARRGVQRAIEGGDARRAR